MTTTQQQLSSLRNTARLNNGSSISLLNNKPTDIPTVSIGLPVYNGENFIEEAIESVLAQTFQDYELVISDNASTDATQIICQRYAQQDSRIRYSRSPVNQGPAWNYNQVFELARGTYFKWAAHDDVFEPTFLERVLERLIQNPTAVLGFSQVDVIEQAAGLIRPYNVEMDLGSARPAQRFKETISLKHRCYEIFGLVRRDVLAKTSLIGAYAGSDRVLLSRLVLEGAFEIVPEPLFKAREHGSQSIAMLRKPRHRHFRMHDYAVWFDPKNKGKILLPNWRILYEYCCAIRAVPMPVTDKLACWLVLAGWLLAYSNLIKLSRDLAIASAQIVGRLKITPPVASQKHT